MPEIPNVSHWAKIKEFLSGGSRGEPFLIVCLPCLVPSCGPHFLVCGSLPSFKPAVIESVFYTLYHSDTKSSAFLFYYKETCN